MDAIMSFINVFFSTIWQFIKDGLDALLYVFKAALFFVFDGLLTVVSGLLSSLDVSSAILSSAATWASMPPQLIYIVNAIGIPQGLAILAGAYVVRMTLNLIPAALTRI
ncbi:MAG: hypothetical protein ACD_74C00099G0013 [uncultured bacterium]|nr:MAG: hypothetical protein ACD_74C00099G0013 [uncultured bacterium]